jgi:hypothetical protein
MKGKGPITLAMTAILFIMATASASQAQGPSGTAEAVDGGAAPSSAMNLAADVSQGFFYQGSLTEDGKPVHGHRQMEFKLYDAGGTQIGATVSRDVELVRGQFNVALTTWGASEFNGQQLNLEVRAQDGSGIWRTLGRTAILGVPYAMGLAPGANVMRSAAGTAFSATASAGIGVYGKTTGNSASMVGVYGEAGNGARAVVARNTGDFDALFAQSNTGAGVTAMSNSGPIFQGFDGDPWDRKFIVQNDGTVAYDGALIGAFPRPNYDSGWIGLAIGQSVSRQHNLGGDKDSYVVEMQCSSLGVITNWGLGSPGGATWQVDTTWVTMQRGNEMLWCDNVRTRIWITK